MHTILKDRKLQKTIRKSEIKDIPQMLEIFQAAKRKMRASGNMLQWDEGYPSEQKRVDCLIVEWKASVSKTPILNRKL